MGDRGQVYIKDEKTYLYTHWGATDLPAQVERAIAKKWRWDDPEYLARIIFDEMTDGSHGEETGFGIGHSQHGDIWMLVIVDCKKQTVTIKEEHFDKGKNDLVWTVKSKKTFSEIAGVTINVN